MMGTQQGKNLRQQAVTRTIRFWGRKAEYIFGILCIIVVIYGVLVGSSAGAENMRDYAWTLGVCLPYALFSGCSIPYLDMAISFGAKRSETAWGSQFMVWLFNLQMFLLTALFNIWIKETWNWIPGYLVCVLFATAIGQFVGCIVLKFGRKGIWIAGIFVAAFVSFVFGSLMAMSPIATGLIEGRILNNGMIAAIAVGIVLYTAGILLWKKLLSFHEVKL